MADNSNGINLGGIIASLVFLVTLSKGLFCSSWVAVFGYFAFGFVCDWVDTGG